MEFYIAVTDTGWFKFLSHVMPEDVNFWQPSGCGSFKRLKHGGPFLFKLRMPVNMIAGIGFFSSYTCLPVSMAWETFGNRNGCDSIESLRSMIMRYRNDHLDPNPRIGCIVLTNPIFFDPEDYIPVPADWAKSIVRGKYYESDIPLGQYVWQQVRRLLTMEKYLPQPVGEVKNQLVLENREERYGREVLTRVRIGQAAFRVLVTEAYQRRCSVSGEKTLPVLEAAHIRPYAQAGPQTVSNGLLLRSDIHKLFDSGYLTITNERKIEVSGRIREEFENGREYYQYHGRPLLYLPGEEINLPDPQFIRWHNDHVYKG